MSQCGTTRETFERGLEELVRKHGLAVKVWSRYGEDHQTVTYVPFREVEALMARVRELEERLEPEKKAGWAIERAEAVSALRSACDKWGDNDWPDTLHLADVIEKHLARHLEGNVEPTH